MKTLYVGTDPSGYNNVVHFPVIEVVPRALHSKQMRAAWDDFTGYTHILFTSKNTVTFFFDALQHLSLPLALMKEKKVIAIGNATASSLINQGLFPFAVAAEEMQEGVIKLFNQVDLSDSYLFYPRSSLARKRLEMYFIQRQVRHQICDLYDTTLRKVDNVPSLDPFDEIIFTSPSTVKAFIEIFGKIPKGKKITAAGPITLEALNLFSDQ